MGINIDSTIFITFLVINLVVGLSVGSKTRTIKEYALGGRNFSTRSLVATIVATWVTGSMFFIVIGKTYSDGLYYFIPLLCIVVQILITVFLLIPRMGEFLGDVSVAESMGNLYGSTVRLITAACGILSMVGYIAVQFKVFGNVFNYFLGIDPTYAIFLASTIVILYSSFGGIKAVTYTDVVQFITFGFVIPLIGIILWNHINNSGLSFSILTENPNFNYKNVLDFNNPKFWAMMPLFLYFTIPSTDPSTFQRISMGRSIHQAKKAWLIAAVLFALIAISIAWIPFLVKIIEPTLESNQVINYLIDNYSYTGLKGLIVVGIFAMAMSTADSCINSSAVLFANDIAKILNIKIDQLLLSKLFSLILGIFAIYLALSKADLLSIVMTTASFYMPIVSVPLLLTILGFRSTTVSVLIGMAGGFITTISMNILETQADGIIWGMAVSIVCLFGSHYLLRQPGGWVGIKDRSYLDEVRSERRNKIYSIVKVLKEFNLIEFCKKTAPKNELVYMGLGIYCIFYTFTTMYSTHVELLRANGKVILGIYQIMMITGTVMAMYPIWPPRIKKEIIVQVGWNIVIFYMLVFFSCFFVMVSNFGQLQFAAFTINVLITALLIGWKFAAGMMLVGFYCSTQFYKFYAGVDAIDVSLGSPQFIFMYSLLLLGSALIIFLKPKQEYLEATEHKAEVLEKEKIKLTHEITNLDTQVKSLEDEKVKIIHEVTNLGAQIKTFEGEKVKLAHEVTDLSTQIKTFEDEKVKLTHEVTSLGTQVVDLEDEKERLASEVTELSGQVLGLNTQVVDLNEQVTHYTQRVEDQNKEIDRLGKTSQKILNNVNHELRLPIGNVINFADMMKETLERTDNNKLLKELSKEVYDNSNRVSSMILNMLDLATLDVKKIDLEKTTINFSELVTDRIKICQKIYLRDKKVDFKLDIEPEIMIAVDPNYMRQTVDNLVINAINFSERGLITVSLIKKVVLKQSGQVIFTIIDQGIGIPEHEISDIFTPFKMGSNTESKACGRGVGLALCKSTIEAHGGDITAESDGKVGAVLRFTLPWVNTNK